jgi:hypothetical protein
VRLARGVAGAGVGFGVGQGSAGGEQWLALGDHLVE